MNTNNWQFALLTSLKKNGVWTTSKYVLDYVLYKTKLKNHVDYKGSKINFRYESTDFTVFREIFFALEYDLAYQEDVKVIIDAGANIGASTVWFAKKFPNSKIIAIEPDKGNFELLCKNVKGLNNVITLNKGLWSSTQKLKISKREDIGEWGFFTSPENNSSEDSIDGISIDDLIAEMGLKKIDVFKIDIEGAEKEIFKSANWLDKTMMLIIETHDWLEEGCSMSVFNALRDKKFATSFSGEKFVITIEN